MNHYSSIEQILIENMNQVLKNSMQIKLFSIKKIDLMIGCAESKRGIKKSGWPSGLRRCVQVAVHLCGRGFESHF